MIIWIKKNFKKLVDLWKEDWVTSFIVFLFFIVIFLFPFWNDHLLRWFELQDQDNIDNIKFLLERCGYIFAGALLIRQVYISHRRAKAMEDTAEAQLKSNIENRYNNTLQYLSNDNNPLAQLGSIDQLYYIAKSNQEYKDAILSLLIERLHILCNKGSTRNIPDNFHKDRINKREKQSIVDKLFRNHPDSQKVFGENYTIDLDLTGFNLSGLCFVKAYLKQVNLGGVKIDGTTFEEANLSNAQLPANLKGCKDMSGAKLNNIKMWTNSDFSGLRLINAVIKNSIISHASLNHADLSKADLTETDLTGSSLMGTDLTNADLTRVSLKDVDLRKAKLNNVRGLTFEQLETVRSLHETTGLERNLRARLKREYPNLFENKVNDF